MVRNDVRLKPVKTEVYICIAKWQTFEEKQKQIGNQARLTMFAQILTRNYSTPSKLVYDPL